MNNTSNADTTTTLALAVDPSGRHLIAKAKAFATNEKLTLQMAAKLPDGGKVADHDRHRHAGHGLDLQ
ncbi:MAG: hypothetical protein ACKPKO_37605, partial [Candidatus Fonsibacter sp.]